MTTTYRGVGHVRSMSTRVVSMGSTTHRATTTRSILSSYLIEPGTSCASRIWELWATTATLVCSLKRCAFCGPTRSGCCRPASATGEGWDRDRPLGVAPVGAVDSRDRAMNPSRQDRLRADGGLPDYPRRRCEERR